MSRKVFLSIITILFSALIQLGCSGSQADRSAEAKNSEMAEADSAGTNGGAKKPEDKIERIPVETTTASRGEIASYLLFSSNLETEKMTDVYSRVQGLIEKIYVEEGDYVEKDQVLLELEAEEFILAEERAEVEFQQRNSAYERAKSMFDKKLLSREEFEQAKFTADAARIAWEQAKLDLKYTRVTAPITGVIGERLCRLGDRIQPSDKLCSVINAEEMIAVVHIPEQEIGKIEKGQMAFIFSDHLRDDVFSGWIKRVSPVVDPQSGTFKVTVGVRNVNNKLRPGMFVNCRIVTKTHKNAVLVPKTAIIYENENMNVFVVRDSIAHKIKLDVGFQDHEKVEALSDIKEGDKIIVVGQAGLKDKTKVKIVVDRT